MNKSAQSVYRELWNLAGVAVPKATLRHYVVRISEEIQTLEREDAEAEVPPSEADSGRDRRHRNSDAGREVEGATGKQADCAAKTREARPSFASRPKPEPEDR